MIIIFQFIIILMLMRDKFFVQKTTKKDVSSDDVSDIIGDSKSINNILQSNNYNNQFRNNKKEEDDKTRTNIFPIENVLNDIIDKLPNDNNQSDFAEEEEEWRRYDKLEQEHGYAQGVTFEELNNIEILLESNNLESNEKKEAIRLVQKIEGTELFTLLEKSMKDQAYKIIQLLDFNSSLEKVKQSTAVLVKNPEDFNIQDFL
ncbi:MAG: hypothetical protein ACN6N7_09630 [Chryseobacterium culicis]